MLKILFSFLYVVVCKLGSAQGMLSQQQREERTLLYSSTLGTYYLVLNTTYLVLGVLILGGLALAYLFASSFLNKSQENFSDYGQSGYSNNYNSQYYQHHYRKRDDQGNNKF